MIELKQNVTYISIGRRFGDLLAHELVEPLLLVAHGRVDSWHNKRHCG